jgi:hypothetical protein
MITRRHTTHAHACVVCRRVRISHTNTQQDDDMNANKRRHDDATTHTHTTNEYNDAIHFWTWHTCADCDVDCCDVAHVHVKSYNAIKLNVDTRNRDWDTLNDDEFDDDQMTLCIECARVMIDTHDANNDADDRFVRATRDALRVHDDRMNARDIARDA